MFKGLRTKIESEQQRGQDNAGARQKSGTGRHSDKTFPRQNTNAAAGTKLIESSPGRDDNVSNAFTTKSPTEPVSADRDHGAQTNKTSVPSFSEQGHTTRNSSANDNDKTISELDSQIIRLRDQLEFVIKERNETLRQKGEPYQLANALGKDEDLNKATNANLEPPSDDKALRENDSTVFGEATSNGDNKRQTAPECATGTHSANISDTSISDNVEVLRHANIELQAKLAKKSRQLKINQQNLTDLKKALQREMFDHSKTQDELSKLQKQMSKTEVKAVPSNHHQDAAMKKQTVNEPNSVEAGDLNGSRELNEMSPSDNRQHDNGPRASSLNANHASEDTVSLNATVGNVAVQFDRLSCLSQSSASVDEFESNDLQHSNKEVSQEYLRNVLFRYMTSTDTETTQHLVKALCVLMDFTPEQSAAIKSSMHGRMSSWLRLK